jgi:peptidoglycan/LPS O-acetylase OafA/YrhL
MSDAARIPVLDGLRAAAILLVFVRHLLPNVPVDGMPEMLLWRLKWFGWIGVDLFFVLSGYLITRSLLEMEGLRHRIPLFFSFRLLRIWPLYLLAVALALTLPFLFSNPAALEGGQWLRDRQVWLWLHAANWLVFFEGELPFRLTILWSLSIEEQFYLLWPFLLFFLPRRVVLRVLVCYLIAAPLIRAGVLAGPWKIDLNVFTPLRLDGFAIGALVYLLPESQRNRVFGGKAGVWIPLVFLLGAFAQQKFVFYQGPAIQSFGYLALAFLFGVLIHRGIEGRLPGPVLRLLSGRAAAFLALHSYAAYLIHDPLGWVAIEAGLLDFLLGSGIPAWAGQLAFFFTVGVATVFLSWMIYHLFEKWFLKLKKTVRFLLSNGLQTRAT